MDPIRLSIGPPIRLDTTPHPSQYDSLSVDQYRLGLDTHHTHSLNEVVDLMLQTEEDERPERSKPATTERGSGSDLGSWKRSLSFLKVPDSAKSTKC